MTDTARTEIDAAKAGAFLMRYADMLNGSFAVLSASVGHRTGLFDAMAVLPPATSHRIAEAADLDERYVREWLGAMVTARIVEYDPSADTYRLPPEHAGILTRAAGPANFAAISTALGVLARVEEQIVGCFRDGGGIGYEHFSDFHRFMGEVSGARNDAMLVDVILPLAPGAVERLEHGIRVADVGCGQGHAVNLMAAAFPRSSFVGLDISDEVLETARAEAAARGLENATFEHVDAPRWDAVEEYDLITTFDAVHDQVDPLGMVTAIHRALRPGGTWLCADVRASSHVGENLDHPLGPMMYTISTMHCMTVSLAGDGAGLGAMWGVQQARALFAEAGFGDVTVHQIDGDASNNYYVAHKEP